VSAVRSIAAAGLISLFAATPPVAAADKSVDGSFAAMAVVETSTGTRQMGFTVVVSHPMTMEETLPYKKILQEGGQQALVNSIRGMGRGSFLLGMVEYPIDVIVAEPNDNGVKYSVVTTRQLQYEEVVDGARSMDYPFTVLVFQVPDFGRGDGKIFTKAALSVDEEGHVKAQQFRGKAGVLKDVRRTN
jgi:hypothetical protein